MSDFNRTHHPRARKPHRCEECRRTIEPGELYERTSAVWEGDFFTSVACAHCAVTRVLVDEEDDWYSEYYYGGLSEWIGEHATDGGRPVPLLRCVVGFGRQWRRRDGTLMPIPTPTEDKVLARITRRWAA